MPIKFRLPSRAPVIGWPRRPIALRPAPPRLRQQVAAVAVVVVDLPVVALPMVAAAVAAVAAVAVSSKPVVEVVVG